MTGPVMVVEHHWTKYLNFIMTGSFNGGWDTQWLVVESHEPVPSHRQTLLFKTINVLHDSYRTIRTLWIRQNNPMSKQRNNSLSHAMSHRQE